MTQASASESPRTNVRFNPTRSRFDAAADAHDAIVGVSCALPVNVGELEAARVPGWMCMGVRKALSSRAPMRPQLAATALCRWPTPPTSMLDVHLHTSDTIGHGLHLNQRYRLRR